MTLAVRVRTGTSDVHITRDITHLSFRSVAPGGFASCTVSLYRPLHLDLVDVDYYGDLIIYDGRSAEVAWQGRIEDIIRGDSGYQLVAVGPSAHTRDRAEPLIYVDRVLDRLDRVALNVSKNGATDTIREDPGGTTEDVMVMQFPEGLTLVTDDKVTMRYRGLFDTGQKLARIDYNDDSGRSAGYTIRARTSVDGLSSFTTVRTNTVSTAGHGSNPKEIGTNWASGANVVDWEFEYDGAGGAVADDTAWASVRGPSVVATRWTAAGAEQVTGAAYPLGSVLAHEIVADLLGRLLTDFDGANAEIATNTFAIPHLAYPDGVSPAEVLEDLMMVENLYFWAAWEDTTNSKARFEWKAWPTVARYEVTAGDGFDAPSSADDVYNRVRVRYRDAKGRILTVERTSTVASLDTAALTRSHSIDLGDEIASYATAVQVGDRFLVEHARPFAKGTVTVARPILDLTLGRYVQPWEIRPGELVRVRDVAPSTGTVADGVATYKLRAVDYDLTSNSSRLELDDGPNRLDRMLARFAVKSLRRR